MAAGPSAAFRIDILAYGADPTGRKSINRALSLAFSDSTASDTVFLPPGRFLLRPFRIPEGKALVGSGKTTVIIPSRKVGGDAPLFSVPGRALLRDFRIEGGGRIRSPWINVGKGAVGVRIASLSFVRCSGIAIRTDHAGIGRSDTSRPAVEISGSRFTNPTTAIEILFSEGILCSSNVIVDPDRSGILFWGVVTNLKKRAERTEDGERCRKIEILGNSVRDTRPILYPRNTKEGIWGAGAVGLVIAGNRVEVAEDVGIDVEWSEDVEIRSNFVRGARNGGIACFFSSRRVLIEGNTVINDYPDLEGYPDGTSKGDRASILLNKDVPNVPACDTAYRCGHRDIAIIANRLVHKADRERRSIYYQVRDNPACPTCPLIHEGRGILIADNVLSLDTTGAPGKGYPLFKGDWHVEGDSIRPVEDRYLQRLRAGWRPWTRPLTGTAVRILP